MINFSQQTELIGAVLASTILYAIVMRPKKYELIITVSAVICLIADVIFFIRGG